MAAEIPIVGKHYHFFDDGKCGRSRHYVAKVKRIIPFKEAHKILTPDGQRNLIQAWKSEVKTIHWLFAPETDCFVECDIPNYDDKPIYFVRTLDGGWFSIDFTSCWQAGRLDITGSIFEGLEEHYGAYWHEIKNNPDYDFA